MKYLEIAPNLCLPLDAVTETFAIMAMRGVGKTHTASIMAEEMLKAGQPVAIYDPTGAWWGLKTSADGKHPGFQVVIFGGEHADVPLEEGAGEIVARAIVENRISAILDCSLLRKAPRLRFMTAFCEELYRLNREPMHLFLDEAHTVAPQNLRAIPEAAKLVGALEDIVTQGRRRGLGLTTITQRPALLNSTLRNVCGTLIVMRVQGPHDRKAIQEWIEESQANPEQAKLVLPSLATLPRGEGWIWSPAWLGLLERVKFRQRETFDSSATPEVGKKAVRPSSFAEIDIAKLGEAIAATVERAKENDPKELRAQLREARRQIEELECSPKEDPVEVADLREESRQLRQNYDSLQHWARGVAKSADARGYALADAADKLADLVIDLRLHIGGESATDQLPAAVVIPDTNYSKTYSEPLPPRAQPARLRAAPAAAPSGDLGSAHMKILAALAKLRAVGVTSPARIQVALFSGYSNAKSGGFAGPMADLVAKGLAQGGNGTVSITPEGLAAAGPVHAPASNRELHAQLRDLLGGAEWKMLELLIHRHPKAIGRSELAEATGYSNAKSGGFAGPLARLTSLGLADAPAPGQVCGSGLLFIR